MTPAEVAGARRLRQLLLTIDLAAFCAIGGIAIYLWFYKPPGQNVYFQLQQRSSLTCLFIWLFISALAAACACHRRTMFMSLSITLLLFLEGASHAYCRAVDAASIACGADNL
jgi:hypothetical protein